MRFYTNGVESGHSGQFDLGVAVGSVTMVDTRGSWSRFCWADPIGTGSSWASASVPSLSEFYLGWGAKPAGGTFTKIDMAGTDSPGIVDYIDLPADGLFRVVDNNLIVATASVAVSLGVWHYFELHYANAGPIEIRVDGGTVLSYAGGLGGPITSINWGTGWARLDDIVGNDITGTTNNSWPGDTGLIGLFPNAPGDVTQLLRGGADSGANWSQVEEHPPNDETDYVYSTVVGDYDLWNIEDLNVLGTILSVTDWIRGRKLDPGLGKIAPMLKSQAVENQGIDQFLSTAWSYGRQIYDVNPVSAAAWTDADIDALQIGAKVR